MDDRRWGEREVIRMGDPLSEGGAIYGARTSYGVAWAHVDVMRRLLLRDGYHVSEQVLDEFRRHMARRLADDARRGGVPHHLKRFLRAPGKRAKERCARGMLITNSQLLRLVCCADEIGLGHRKKIRELMPEHLALSKADLDSAKASTKAGVSNEKFFRNVNARFEERRLVWVHLFEEVAGPAWHMFFASAKDTESRRRNHWHGGEHLHYIGHEWGAHVNKDELWEQFDSRDVSASSLHISFDKIGHWDNPDARGRMPWEE